MKFSASHRRIKPTALALCAALVVASAFADEGDNNVALPKLSADVTKVPFDELLEVEVTSVSKRAEPVGAAAAAVFVLTADEIQRAGVHSVADALRLVPGLQVAQQTAAFYAISARGFDNVNADKLEVLLDGRSVYTPLTSSVFWDVLDTYLPDIDRIEVIRGPGATLWGANAVNGVINIITKDAKQTQGVSASAHAGNEERYGAAARLGVAAGRGNLRLYAQDRARDGAPTARGSQEADGERLAQTGFRSDWQVAGQGTLTVSGDAYQGTEKVTTFVGTASGPVADIDRSGGNLLARLQCCAEDDGRWSIQASYDGYHIVEPTIFVEKRETAAADFQQQWRLGARNTLVYGTGLKYSHDETGGPPLLVILDPDRRTLTTYSAFMQDQLSFLDNAATLTLGSKFERNSFSGFEVQPSIRFGWQASLSVFTWAAISRAVRTPNRVDQNIAIFCPPPDGFPGICGPGISRIGNPNLDSEKLIAYEWGIRLRSSPHVSWDLATYFNHYSSLISTESTSPLGAYGNGMRAQGYGAELSVAWQPSEQFELRPWYSFSTLDAKPDAGSTDTTSAALIEGSTPRHQAGLLLAYFPTRSWYVGSFLRYVDTLKQTAGAVNGPSRVPTYTELNLRVARTFAHGLELSLVGQNLLHPRHAEFGTASSRSELQRGGFVELRWNWQ